MFTKVKEVMNSRKFQTGAGRVAIDVVGIVVSATVARLVTQGLNAGLEGLMDKIHGKIEDVVTTVE